MSDFMAGVRRGMFNATLLCSSAAFAGIIVYGGGDFWPVLAIIAALGPAALTAEGWLQWRSLRREG